MPNGAMDPTELIVYMCVFLFSFTEQVTTRMEHRSDTAIIRK